MKIINLISIPRHVLLIILVRDITL
ncbi:hypothetical protein LINGRAHAP2_LOCUS19532 [Linum grandiflorum]